VAKERITGSKVRNWKRISVKAKDCEVKTEVWLNGASLSPNPSGFIPLKFLSAVMLAIQFGLQKHMVPVQ
jgi:hypothetical protein